MQMATVVMLRLLIIMLGLQLMIKLMMTMMTMMKVMVIVATIAALVTRAAHAHGGISHHGNSHQNVNQIVLYANEMHQIKNAITQKVEMKAQEKDKFYYDKKHCNLKVCTAYYTVTYLLYNAIPLYL